MRRDERGFVVAFVVFMLFAISVAGATGYMLVSSEFALARYSGDGTEALTVARAGLERYVAEQLGTLTDTASYALGGGVAVVTARRMADQDSVTALYYIRSEGTVDDIFSPGTPARRVVGGYAVYRQRPLPHYAAVVIGADVVRAEGGGEAHGQDYKTAADCPGGGASTITGAIARVSVTEENADDIQGSPQSRIWPGGWSAIRDSIRIRWDVLSDPNFPVEFENTLPNFAALPADSFPVVRYTGWVTASWTGRGVLIIDGVFDPTSSFNWDGIVLARHADDIVQGEIDGMLIAGLESPNMYSTVRVLTDVNYHSCYVYAANESLSYLELIPSSIHETN
jgi:hypothetical protein